MPSDPVCDSADSIPTLRLGSSSARLQEPWTTGDCSDLTELKFSNNKNLAPQLHQSHFKCLVATCAPWPALLGSTGGVLFPPQQVPGEALAWTAWAQGWGRGAGPAGPWVHVPAPLPRGCRAASVSARHVVSAQESAPRSLPWGAWGHVPGQRWMDKHTVSFPGKIVLS